MRHCYNCKVDIKGDHNTCPLCHESLLLENNSAEQNPYPDIPLRFNKQQVVKLLIIVSIITIGLWFIMEGLSSHQITPLKLVLLGVMSMWLVVLIIIRKRRNIAKGIVYLIISLSLIGVYFDCLDGFGGWSTTYVVPIICSFAIIAMFIAVRVVRLEVGDYVLYLLVATLLGLIPALFLLFDLVTQPIPAMVSVGLSGVMLILILVFWGSDILGELKKRMHI